MKITKILILKIKKKVMKIVNRKNKNNQKKLNQSGKNANKKLKNYKN